MDKEVNITVLSKKYDVIGNIFMNMHRQITFV
jgi:hypothetical protein